MELKDTIKTLPDTAEPRQLLVVAFHYPPDNTSTGVLRTLKFTEYLVKHKWASEVISVPEELYVSKDPASIANIPQHVNVHRVWAADIKSLISIRGIYPSILAFPDRFWSWIFSATEKASQLIKSKNISAVYTTYPVSTAHMVGLRLKRRFGLPWIADFRDPWVEDSMPPLRRWAEGLLERQVLTHADKVICNTPAMRRYFLSRYPKIPPDKFVTITNGYDEADFSHVSSATGPKFEILYPGLISKGNRNPRPLLAGIRLALDRGWLSEQDLRVTFLGSGLYSKTPEFRQELDQYKLQEIVNIIETRIPYRQAIKRLANADVLVVLSEPLGQGPQVDAERRWSHLQVPAKVYEYLRLGRPMLALVSGGAVEELLRETGSGIPVSPTDIEGIAQALKRHYSNRHSVLEESKPILSRIVQYNRENLTALLARELDSLTSAHAFK